MSVCKIIKNRKPLANLIFNNGCFAEQVILLLN